MPVKNPLMVIDVETDGPAPGRDLYSMVSFAAVIVEPGLSRTFSGQVRPISKRWLPEALAISKYREPVTGELRGITRKVHELFPPPAIVIPDFRKWVVEQIGASEGEEPRAVMISDNIAFDWSFISFYLWTYTNSNPFGHSGRRINDLYAGTQGDAGATQGWKKFRKTKHTHDPLDDARGMAEALLEMKARGLRFANIPDEYKHPAPEPTIADFMEQA